MIHKTRIHGMSHLFFSLVDVYCDFLSVRMMSLLSIFALKGGHISMKFFWGGGMFLGHWSHVKFIVILVRLTVPLLIFPHFCIVLLKCN